MHPISRARMRLNPTADRNVTLSLLRWLFASFSSMAFELNIVLIHQLLVQQLSFNAAADLTKA